MILKTLVFLVIRKKSWRYIENERRTLTISSCEQCSLLGSCCCIHEFLLPEYSPTRSFNVSKLPVIIFSDSINEGVLINSWIDLRIVRYLSVRQWDVVCRSSILPDPRLIIYLGIHPCCSFPPTDFNFAIPLDGNSVLQVCKCHLRTELKVFTFRCQE